MRTGYQQASRNVEIRLGLNDFELMPAGTGKDPQVSVS
jgi:hypothetical protein